MFKMSKSVLSYASRIPGHLPTLIAHSIGPSIVEGRPDLERSWVVKHCPYCRRPHLFEAGQAVRRACCPKSDGDLGHLLEGRQRPSRHGVVFGGTLDDKSAFQKLFRDDAIRIASPITGPVPKGATKNRSHTSIA